MALAVGDLDGDPTRDEVVFAPLYNPMPHTGQKARSYVHVLSGASGQLVEIGASPVLLGDPNDDDFIGYGACGIAITEVAPHGKIVVVTTLNGELVVFGVLPGGALNPAPLFRTVVEGSLGGFNALVVADLDPTPKPELYVSGSSGLRRFNFQ